MLAFNTLVQGQNMFDDSLHARMKDIERLTNPLGDSKVWRLRYRPRMKNTAATVLYKTIQGCHQKRHLQVQKLAARKKTGDSESAANED